MQRLIRGQKLRECQALLHAANRLYRHRYGVVGIGVGSKYKAGRPVLGSLVVQFYVTQKRPLSELDRPVLPSFMLSRRHDGSVNRRKRILTDVIEVGTVTPACRSGDIIRSLNDAGSISLLFRNRAAGDTSSVYALTCSHVVGDMRSSPPNPDVVTADCEPDQDPFAKVMVCSLPSQGRMPFDIALIKLEPTVPTQPNCEVNTIPPVKLNRLMSESEVTLPLQVMCALPSSPNMIANIQSRLGTVRVQYRTGEVELSNAFLLDTSVAPGDSGGTIFSGQTAIGIVFARSEVGFGWCHLLSHAIDAINHMGPVTVRPF